MVEPTAHHPLLNTPNRTLSNCKTLYFVIAICLATALVIFSLDHLNPLPFKASSHFDICHHSHDPQECLAFVSEVACDGVTQKNDANLLKKILMKYIHHMNKAILETEKIKNQINDQNEHGALEDCLELIDLSVDRVTDSIIALGSSASPSYDPNLQTWLSGVLTNHVTCLDGLNVAGRKLMGEVVQDLISRARASLALLAAVHTAPIEEEMLQPLKGKMPSWLTLRDRKLLEKSAKDIEADAVVAQDGTGDYKTVAEAVAAAPDKSKKRYVIHVKKGTYVENVEVTKKKKNLMIVGDGMNLTIITGSLNVVDGSTTFRSATLAAVGDGFILQDICIQNTAGPEKHQAVALRVGADQSVINRCRLDAYQDTLYSHSLRQFYRDCYITGTVDYIFGNAAVVYQNSKLAARKPMKNQQNMVTAQGRTDPNQNTGTSIQNCEIIASDDLEPVKQSFRTYLGRPWKEYARVVVLQSYIGDEIDPAGWSVWSGDFALKTLYFGEYMNKGPGAGTSKRVNWTGYHVITDPAEAMKFTVAELIQVKRNPCDDSDHLKRRRGKCIVRKVYKPRTDSDVCLGGFHRRIFISQEKVRKMEDIFVAILSMLLVLALVPLYLWKRRLDSRSPDQPLEEEEPQVRQRETVVRATGARRMRRRAAASGASSSSAAATVEETVDESDDEAAGDGYYTAKASKKKEKKRQEREAQRQADEAARESRHTKQDRYEEMRRRKDEEREAQELKLEEEAKAQQAKEEEAAALEFEKKENFQLMQKVLQKTKCKMEAKTYFQVLWITLRITNAFLWKILLQSSNYGPRNV